MDASDERSGARAAGDTRDAAAEHAGGEKPASPEQGPGDDGFATGVDQSPDPPEEDLQPNFARGIADEELPGTEHKGTFAEGAEQTPDAPENEVERRFSEGIERSPTSD